MAQEMPGGCGRNGVKEGMNANGGLKAGGGEQIKVKSGSGSGSGRRRASGSDPAEGEETMKPELLRAANARNGVNRQTELPGMNGDGGNKKNCRKPGENLETA